MSTLDFKFLSEAMRKSNKNSSDSKVPPSRRFNHGLFEAGLLLVYDLRRSVHNFFSPKIDDQLKFDRLPERHHRMDVL